VPEDTKNTSERSTQTGAPGGAEPTPAPAVKGKWRGRLLGLVIFIAVLGIIWVADAFTGRHLRAGLARLNRTLVIMRDQRRDPGDECSPQDLADYTAVKGIAFEVPSCWDVEVASFLGTEKHVFRDNESRAGRISVSVEKIENDEDRAAVEEEFKKLSARQGALVDESEKTPAPAQPGSAGASGGEVPGTESVSRAAPPSGGGAPAPSTKPGAAAPAGAGASAAEAAADDGETPPPEPSARRAAAFGWVHTVRTRGLVGATIDLRKVDVEQGIPDAAYERIVWNWLLIGPGQMVRVEYAVRKDWIERGVPSVIGEYQSVLDLVASIHPVS
jgi:hypothetical protein